MEPMRRAEILANIKQSYKKYANAKAKSEKFAAAGQASKASEWMGNMQSAGRHLELAFQQLPEVRLSETDMDAVTFAKSLLEPTRSPAYLPGQADFLGP